MTCKFKYGDRVRIGTHVAKVVSVYKDHRHYMCKVKFENRFLIPQEMEYTEDDLELLEVSKLKDRKCTCGMYATYGNIPEQNHSDYCDLKKTPEEDSDNYNTDSLLEQFELMLGNDDDDDDFGFYGV